MEKIIELSKLIETVISPTNFSLKIVNKNQIRLSCNTVEAYKATIDLIRSQGLIGHTFTRKDQRPCRFVIKNLHHTTPIENIVEEIEKSGNKVIGEIINARYGPNKDPTSTFFVNVEQCENNKKVKDIKFIYHQSVHIEDPRKRKTLAQCQRCQQYGHTKNYCMRPYRCVKCGESHKTSDCPRKDKNTPATCALCQGEHPANYKGCEIYKEILKRKNKLPQKRQVQEKPPKTNFENLLGKEQFPALKPKTNYWKLPRATQNNNDQPREPTTSSNDSQHKDRYDVLENIILKQTEKIDILLQQISTMLGLITTLLSKSK